MSFVRPCSLRLSIIETFGLPAFAALFGERIYVWQKILLTKIVSPDIFTHHQMS